MSDTISSLSTKSTYTVNLLHKIFFLGLDASLGPGKDPHPGPLLRLQGLYLDFGQHPGLHPDLGLNTKSH